MLHTHSCPPLRGLLARGSLGDTCGSTIWVTQGYMGDTTCRGHILAPHPSRSWCNGSARPGVRERSPYEGIPTCGGPHIPLCAQGTGEGGTAGGQVPALGHVTGDAAGVSLLPRTVPIPQDSPQPPTPFLGARSAPPDPWLYFCPLSPTRVTVTVTGRGQEWRPCPLPPSGNPHPPGSQQPPRTGELRGWGLPGAPQGWEQRTPGWKIPSPWGSGGMDWRGGPG